MSEPSLDLKPQELGKPIPEIDIYWDHTLGLLASCTQLYARAICYWPSTLVILKQCF